MSLQPRENDPPGENPEIEGYLCVHGDRKLSILQICDHRNPLYT